jgi:hypothetical protein
MMSPTNVRASGLSAMIPLMCPLVHFMVLSPFRRLVEKASCRLRVSLPASEHRKTPYRNKTRRKISRGFSTCE